MSLKNALKLLSKKNVIPLDTTERNYLLRLMGYDCIKTFQELDNLIAMMFLEMKYLVDPWTIKARYCDPVFKVILVEVYFHSLCCTVPMWLCVESIIEAGKSPLFGQDLKQIQDMAFISDQQEHAFISAMFEDAVPDEDGEPYLPELSFHIQYILDVIFGIRGYETPDGISYVATDLNIADKWRIAICAEGKRKMKKVVTTERYIRFVTGIDDLNEIRKNTSPVYAEVREQSKETVKLLTARL